MKKLILFSILLVSSAFAGNYKLDDPAIIGEYKLVTTDKKSDVQSAQIRYDEEDQLVVDILDIEEPYVLSEPDKNGVVVDEEIEIQCEDSSCGGVSHVMVQLLSTENKKGSKKGTSVPGLSIQITKTYPGDMDPNTGDWDFEDETKTYTLVWNKALTNGGLADFTDVTSDFDKIADACRANVQPYVRSIIYSQSEACPIVSVHKYRVADAIAMKTVINFFYGNPPVLKPSSLQEIDQLIYAKKIDQFTQKAKDKKKTAELPGLLAEIEKLRTFISQLKVDQVYLANDPNSLRMAVLVDETAKTVTLITIF
jgi:hypothetical protein